MLEVKYQDIGRVGSFWKKAMRKGSVPGLSLWLVNGCFLILSSWTFLCGCLLSVIISSYKNTSHTGLGPIPMTSFYLNYLFKDCVSKYSHILKYWVGIRTSVIWIQSIIRIFVTFIKWIDFNTFSLYTFSFLFHYNANKSFMFIRIIMDDFLFSFSELCFPQAQWA